MGETKSGGELREVDDLGDATAEVARYITPQRTRQEKQAWLSHKQCGNNVIDKPVTMLAEQK
jgi:hypothetical protein